jgi:hypothetical protein
VWRRSQMLLLPKPAEFPDAAAKYRHGACNCCRQVMVCMCMGPCGKGMCHQMAFSVSVLGHLHLPGWRLLACTCCTSWQLMAWMCPCLGRLGSHPHGITADVLA